MPKCGLLDGNVLKAFLGTVPCSSAEQEGHQSQLKGVNDEQRREKSGRHNSQGRDNAISTVKHNLNKLCVSDNLASETHTAWMLGNGVRGTCHSEASGSC